jgi:hypothetical protein
MKNQYFVTLKTYNQFVSENKTNNLDKHHKLSTTTYDNIFKLTSKNEVFKRPLEVEYTKEDTPSQYFPNLTNTVYLLALGDTEYRLDLIPYYDGCELYLVDKEIVSISFSLAHIEPTEENTVEYESLTNKDEAIRLLNAITYLIQEYGRDVIYSVGQPDESKKYVIYKSLIKNAFPDYIVKYGASTMFTNKKSIYLAKSF